MSLLLLLACLCGAAARGAPTAARCLPESELDGYCRRRRLDCDAPLIGGEPASTDDDDDDDDSLVSGKKVIPSPGWDTCVWIESNSNTDAGPGEQYVGEAKSPWQCIAMVREQYPDATIANIQRPGTGSCYAQYGFKLTKDPEGGWKSCLLTSLPDVPGGPYFSADGIFIATDASIRRAVKLWGDDEAKATKKYGHISTWETGSVTNIAKRQTCRRLRFHRACQVALIPRNVRVCPQEPRRRRDHDDPGAVRRPRRGRRGND